MILANCYYVCYYVADFSNCGKRIGYENSYLNYDNALLAAKEIIKCLDVDGDVNVISGRTGEILNTLTSTTNAPEHEEKRTAHEPFADGFGGVWQHNKNEDLWSYDCTGQNCEKCPYHCGDRDCATDNLSLDEVEEIIAVAMERIGR